MEDQNAHDPLYRELTEVRSIGNPARLFFRVAAVLFLATLVMAKQPWVDFPNLTDKVTGYWQTKK